MTRRLTRLVATALLALWPQWVLAQALAPAGVVTTLAGEATVTRASLPQPAPLRFKDEVFVRDTIRTRERSVVRVLLGGKAVVTAREMSVLTITEDLGRSTVDLVDGKIALSVARPRMRPGEVIEIKTPNALAGVRGTVVIAEVLRASADAGGGHVPVTTNFYVLHGTVDVVPRDVPNARPSMVGPLQTVSVTGSTAGQVTSIPPAQVAQILSGLKSGPQHQETPDNGKQRVSTVQQQQATALASVLAPASNGSSGQQGKQQQQGEQGQQSNQPPSTGGAPTTIGGSNGGSTGGPGPDPAPAPAPDPTPLPMPQPPPDPTPGPPPLPPPPVPVPLIPVPVPAAVPEPPTYGPVTGQFVSLGPTETLATFGGTSVQTTPRSVIQIGTSTVSQPSGSLIVGSAGSDTTLIGTLLDVASSSVAGSRVLDLAGALRTSASLLAFDPSTVSAGNVLTVEPTGSLSVAGSLLTDVGGTYAVTGDVATVSGSLRTTAAAAAFDVSGSTITSGTTPASFGAPATDFFRVSGSGASVTLAGPLLAATGTSLTQKGTALVDVSNGATLTATASLPFLGFSGGSLTLGSGVIGVRVGTGSTMTVGGPLLAAAGTTLNLAGSAMHLMEVSAGSSLTAGALLDLSNTTLNMGGLALVALRGASALTFTGAAPVIRLTNASVTADQLIDADGSGNAFSLSGAALDLTSSTLALRALGKTDSGSDHDAFGSLASHQPFMRLASSTFTTTEPDDGGVSLGDNATMPITAGVAIVTSGTAGNPTSIALSGRLFHLKAGTFTATDPLVQLDHTTVTQTATTRPLLAADFAGGVGTLAAPFMTASASALNASGRVFELAAATLVSAAAAPFITLTSTDVTAPHGDVVGVGSRTSTGSLLLSGSLLSAIGGTLDATNPNVYTVGSSITTGAGTAPQSLAVGVDGTAYVGNSSAGTVAFVDPTTGSVSASVAIPGGMANGMIAVTPDGARVYAVNRSTVALVDPVTHAVTTMAAGVAPAGVAIARDGSRVYVANQGSNSVSIIDNTLATPVVIGSIGVGTSPRGLAVTPDGSFLYVANRADNSVSVIDTNSETVVRTITAGIGTTPFSIAMTPDGSRAYVTDFGSSDVSVIDTATGKVMTSIAVGLQPRSIVITSDGSRAYVTNAGAGSVSVIDLNNNTVLATVGIATAEDVALTPDGTHAYVTATGSDALRVLDASAGGRFLSVMPGTMLVSTGSTPLVHLDGSTVRVGKSFIGVDGGTLFVGGSLLETVNNAHLTSGGSVLSITQDGVVADAPAVSSTAALFSLGGGSLTASRGNIVTVSGNGSTPGSATLALGRPLFSATGTTIDAFFHFLRIADGGDVTSTATTPLIQLNGGSYTGGTGGVAGTGAGGALLRMMAIAGQSAPSLTLTDGFLLASGGATLNASSGSMIDVRDGATVTSTGTTPFLDFQNASASAAVMFAGFGPDATTSGATGTGASPDVSFAGSFLRAADSGTAITLASASRSFISIFDGASVTASGIAPFLDLLGSAPGNVVVNANRSLLFVGTTTAGMSAPTLQLAGPLLRAQNAIVTSGDTLGTLDGGTLRATGTSPLVSLTNTSVVTGTSPFVAGAPCVVGCTRGQLLFVGGQTFGNVSTASLAGPLLDASGGTLDLRGGLLNVQPDGSLDMGGNTAPLVTITGGSHSMATIGDAAMIQLVGNRTHTAIDSVDLDGAGGSLTLATDTPLTSQAGDGIDLVGATVGAGTVSREVVLLDAALLNASAPLLNMKAASALTTALDAVTVQNQSSLISAGPLAKLDASTLTINTGAFLRVAGGSLVKVTGDLLTITGGGVLNLLNGPLVSIQDGATAGSVLTISGGLIRFGTASGNTVNITNTLCASACPTVAGLPVFLSGGATLAQVSVATPIKNLGGNTLNVSATAAVLAINGAKSRITVSGN